MTTSPSANNEIPRIPVTEAQFHASLRSMLEPIIDASCPIRNPEDLPNVLSTLKADLNKLSWLACVDVAATQKIRLAVDNVAAKLHDPHFDRCTEITALVELCSTIGLYEFSNDVWKDAFGISREQLSDSGGAIRSARLLAHYYQRPKDLARAAITFMFLANSNSLMPSVALGATVVGMLGTPNPLVTMRAMATMRSHLAAVGDTGARQRLDVLATRADPSSNSSLSYNAVVKMIDMIEDPRTRATWVLESYRKLAEGQIRGWLWLLLSTASEAAEPPPMLGNLEKRLVQDPRPEVRALLSFLRPAWRNAAAHEDVRFNENDQLLEANGSVVELEEVQARVAEALAFHAGCEVALSNYRPEFEDEPPRGVITIPRAYQLLRAREWFGDNGLLIRSLDLRQSTLVAQVEDLTTNQIDPCFQSIVQSKLDGVRLQRAEVRRTTDSTPAVVVSMTSIGLTETIWKRVRGFATKNPAAHFSR